MSLLSEAEIAEIEDVVLVANTPRYLIKGLRALSSVQQLAKLPLSRLKDEYAINKGVRPAVSYAVLASLLSKDYAEMTATTDQLDLSGLRFSSQSLTSTLVALSNPLTVQTFDLTPPRLVGSERQPAKVSTSGSLWIITGND